MGKDPPAPGTPRNPVPPAPPKLELPKLEGLPPLDGKTKFPLELLLIFTVVKDIPAYSEALATSPLHIRRVLEEIEAFMSDVKVLQQEKDVWKSKFQQVTSAHKMYVMATADVHEAPQASQSPVATQPMRS